MQEIVFRPAQPMDYLRIADLHAASWRRAYRGLLPARYLEHAVEVDRRDVWKTRLNAPGADRRHVPLAEHAGRLLGFACVLLDEHPGWGAYLDNLHVHPEYTGRRMGRRLMSEAVRWVMAREPSWPLHLWVFEANCGARRFYESFGGRAVARGCNWMPGGVYVPAVRYVWPDTGRLLDDLTRG